MIANTAITAQRDMNPLNSSPKYDKYHKKRDGGAFGADRTSRYTLRSKNKR